MKKIQRALQVRIPTNDEQVKHRLRFLGHPICFFAENVTLFSFEEKQIIIRRQKLTEKALGQT